MAPRVRAHQAAAPQSKASDREPSVLVRVNPELRAYRVRVYDRKGREHVIEAGEVKPVPKSAFDNQGSTLGMPYLIKT